MGWKSIHWNRSEFRQRTRFERYADDSWMLLLALGRTYIAFKGRTRQPRSRSKVQRLDLPTLQRRPALAPRQAANHDCNKALAGATLLGESNAHPANAGEFAARWNASTPAQRDALMTQLATSQEQADRCIRNNHQATIEELLTRRSHIIWYPLYDQPLDLRMSREQLQCVHDVLLGKPEVVTGWAHHFAGEIERVLQESLREAPTPTTPTGEKP